jgi:hypothetical protein
MELTDKNYEKMSNAYGTPRKWFREVWRGK